jgi:hypothetical protein
MTSPSPSSSPANGTGARLATVLAAKAPQIVALYLAIKEQSRESVRDSVIIFCVVALVGAQAAQNIILGAIDRVLGSDKEP